MEELGLYKLPSLLKLKYNSIQEAKDRIGDSNTIRETFISFQQYLYQQKVA